jgi:K+-sensing histidine kinase KdpD
MTNRFQSKTNSQVLYSNSLKAENIANNKAYQQNFFSSLKILHHSINTPLTNILLNLQLLAKDTTFQQKSNNQLYLYRAILSAKYIKNIMQQSYQQQSLQKTFCPKQALREVIEICIKPMVEGQLISFLRIPEQLELCGNQLYFQEAMICLLNNAFQAYNKNSANKLVVLSCHKNKKFLTIKIADGGSGFLCLKDHAASKTKINKVRKLGTGLPFAQQVIEQHFQGKLEIETYPQRGSTIHCSFPLTK